MTGLQAIRYRGGSADLTGYLADGSGGAPAPGILVAHEGGGLGRHAKDKAAQLAERGYVAFALDLYGEEEPAPERAIALGRALRDDVSEMRTRMQAALDVLTAKPHVDAQRLAVIGFCMGGTAAIELARTGAPLRCLVGFHSGFRAGAPEENRAIRGHVLLCHGAADSVVGEDVRNAFLRELDDAGIGWELHLYGGVGHSFTNPLIDALGYPGFAYDAGADRRSWRAMLDLFGDMLEAT